MKNFFVGMAAVVVVLWGVAILIEPPPEFPDKTVLRWSTDPNPARGEQIAPFMEKYDDLAVVVEPNTFDRTIVQCSTGIGPDLIEIYNIPDMVAYAEAGILMDLTPYAEEYGFGPDSTYEKLVDGLKVDGKLYRYPANAASQVLIYNKRMFRERGVPYPTDGMAWEDFIELVKPLTVERTDGKKGFEQFAMVMGRGFAKDIHLQYGAEFFNEDATECVLDSPESIAAVQRYLDLMWSDQVIPTPEASEALSGEGGWGVGEIRWFATGKAASIWGSRWMMVQFRIYEDLREELGCVLLPCPKGRQPICYAGGRGPGINVNSPNKEAALKFLGYLASDDYSEIIAKSSDALPPNRKYAENLDNLINEDYPWETYQVKFVESMKLAESERTSPFVSLKAVERIWLESLESVENRAMTPEEAMRLATKRINDLIQKNLRDQPELKAKYDQLRNDSLAAVTSK